MSDETFRVTPNDVRRWDLPNAMRGYDKAAVENFRNQVADEMDRLARANQELETKAKGFHEQLRAFRERDKALNDALVSAQQLRGETREQAEREAHLILREARAEGERILEIARNEIRRLEDDVLALEKARRTYLAQLRILAERQLAQVEAAEEIQPPVPEEEGERDNRATPAWLDSLIKE